MKIICTSKEQNALLAAFDVEKYCPCYKLIREHGFSACGGTKHCDYCFIRKTEWEITDGGDN